MPLCRKGNIGWRLRRARSRIRRRQCRPVTDATMKMNRHERRRAEKLFRLGNRALKLRCIGCNNVGTCITKEHFFPRWLIEYADVRRDGISWPRKEGLDWIENKNVNPDKAVVPLCDQCNEVFGRVLERPAAEIFRALDRGEGISDYDAELLVRWLWKFEGLQWGIFRDHNTQEYTTRYSLRERVTTSKAFDEIRASLVLAVALANANDPDYVDWPMGLDTPMGGNAITMSGVFRRVALIVSLAEFADRIHPAFGKYAFGQPPSDRATKIFVPPCSFATARAAIGATQESALTLSVLHDAWGREKSREYEEEVKRGNFPHLIFPPRRRILFPPI